MQPTKVTAPCSACFKDAFPFLGLVFASNFLDLISPSLLVVSCSRPWFCQRDDRFSRRRIPAAWQWADSKCVTQNKSGQRQICSETRPVSASWKQSIYKYIYIYNTKCVVKLIDVDLRHEFHLLDCNWQLGNFPVKTRITHHLIPFFPVFELVFPIVWLTIILIFCRLRQLLINQIRSRRELKSFNFFLLHSGIGKSFVKCNISKPPRVGISGIIGMLIRFIYNLSWFFLQLYCD